MNIFKNLYKNNLPGKFKGLFFRFRMDRVTPIYLFNFFAHAAILSKWISENKNKCKNDFYNKKFEYKKREELYKQVISDFDLDSEIDYFEFGVSKGESFRWWINKIKNPNARFYGFDTFTGLPEDWGIFKAGDMSNGNEKPKINDNRHQFFQGLFQQTLLPFLDNYQSKKRKIIHMDADIYSATLYVLTLFTPYLQSGDIIFFDEFNVPMHEFKAFDEWTKSFYINYEVLGGVNNFYQTAIKIK